MSKETELFEKFVAARIKCKNTLDVLQAAIDRHTENGQLIQYGDLPEYPPASEARYLFIYAAIAYADYVISSRATPPAPAKDGEK